MQSSVKALARAASSCTTLRDGHGRFHDYLRISLTERCNFRCRYCMPPEGVSLTAKPELLSTDELHRLLKLFVANGVRRVRFTGGEPTLRKDLPELIAYTSSIGVASIGLTTNGLTLSRTLPQLLRSGLNAVNISLDTLQPAKFTFITRFNAFDKVWRSIDLAERLFEREPQMPKLNVVAMRGLNDDEICDFVELSIRRRLDVRFIEYMPFGGNRWDRQKLLPFFEMLDAIKCRFGEIERLVDPRNSTSRGYKVPGSRGQFGFISSMTANFCSTCNRIRLTADGNLKVCLHDASETSLKDLLRQGASDSQIQHAIHSALSHKKPVHAGNLASGFKF